MVRSAQVPGEGGVFLIGSGHYLAVIEKYGRSDVKLTVRRVGPVCGLSGLVDKAAVDGVKFVKTHLNHRHTDVKLLHNRFRFYMF